jgi:hypothetical protein
MNEQSISTISPSLAIIIDNFKFQLVQLISVNSKYSQVVQIRVLQPDTNEKISSFWVYRSNSELGIWRLCISSTYNIDKMISGKGTWYKGNANTDYVQSTFIHISLQNFINDNLELIPKNKMSMNKEERIKEMDDECVCDVMGNTKCRHFKLVKIVDDPNRTIIESPFKEIYNKERNHGIGCGRLNPDTNSIDLKKILEEFTTSFGKTYNIVNLNIVTNNYQFTFVNTIHLQGDIYSIELHRKYPIKRDTQTNVVLLYFMVVNMTPIIQKTSVFYENVSQICMKKYHIFPFFLTIPTAKINEVGLYDKYIPCGLYVCKLFDYSIASAKQCTNEEINSGRCNELYSYIGTRYDDMFPLKEALDTIRANTKCSLKKESTPDISKYHTPEEMSHLDVLFDKFRSIESKYPSSFSSSSSSSSRYRTPPEEYKPRLRKNKKSKKKKRILLKRKPTMRRYSSKKNKSKLSRSHSSSWMTIDKSI